MRIFVLMSTYELRVSRKSHLRDHPKSDSFISLGCQFTRTVTFQFKVTSSLFKSEKGGQKKMFQRSSLHFQM
jgi:hypothetical protein